MSTYVPTLEEISQTEQYQAMAPSEMLELVGVWRDQAEKAIDTDLGAPDQWQVRQEAYGRASSDAAKFSEAITQDMGNRYLADKFKGDNSGLERFITDYNNNLSNPAAMAPEHSDIAKGLAGIQNQSLRSHPQSGVVGSVTDPQGRSMADIALQYGADGKPRYANVIFNKYEEQSNLEESAWDNVPLVKDVRRLYDVIQGPGYTQTPSGGDVVKFPSGFNGEEYYKNHLYAERRNIDSEVERLSYVNDTSNPIPGMNAGPTFQFIEADKQSRRKKENSELIARAEASAEFAERQGGIQFIRDHIKTRVADNDPLYGEFGSGLLEGLGRQFQSYTEQLPARLSAGTAVALESVTDLMSEMLPETRMDGENRPNQLLSSAQQFFARAAEQRNEVADHITSFQGGMDLDVTNPGAAEIMRNTTGAVAQGMTIAASSVLGAPAMFATSFLEQSANKYQEIDNAIKTFRAEGKTEDAEYLERNKAKIANLSGVVSGFIENVVKGDSIIPIGNALKSSFFRNVSAPMMGEGVEGIADNLAQFGTDVVNGLATMDELPALIEGLPMAGFYEMAGAGIPSLARGVVTEFQKRAIEEGTRNAYNNTQQTPDAIDRASKLTAIQKSVTDIVDGDPGDNEEISPITFRKKPSKGYEEDIRNHAYNMYYDTLRELEGMGDNPRLNVVARDSENTSNKSVILYHPGKASPSFRENAFNRDVKKGAISGEGYDDSVTEDQRSEIAKAYDFDVRAAFSGLRDKSVVVTDYAGRSAITSSAELKKMIEDGSIDPSKHLFFAMQTMDDTRTSYALSSMIPQENLINSKARINNSLVLDTEIDGEKYKAQSKASEQLVMQNTPYGIDTVTVGGKMLYPNSPITAMEDMMDDADISVTETAEVNGKQKEVLTAPAKSALVKKLNERFGENGWVLKKNSGLQRDGFIHSADPASFDAEGNLVAQIPVDQQDMYIAQESILDYGDKAGSPEMRISAMTGSNGRLQLLPGGVFNSGGGFGPRLTAFPKDIGNKINEMLEALSDTEINSTPGLIYGMDVATDRNGNLRVLETNPIDEIGEPGSVTLYSSGMNSVTSNVLGNYSLEESINYVAWLKHKGKVAASERMLELAIKQNGLKASDIPGAAMLRKRGVFFASPESTRERINQIDKGFIQSLNLDPESETVETLLKKFLDHPNENFVNLARDLLAAASKNPGLQVKVKLGTGRAFYDSANKQVTVAGGSTTYMHEVIHALTDGNFPAELSVYNYAKLTGRQYKTILDNALNNDSFPPEIKAIIRNYIAAVEGLGMTNNVFGDRYARSGSNSRNDIPYGLSDISEFMTEAITNLDFSNSISQIPDSRARGAIRRLLDNVLNWIRQTLFNSGTPSKNLFDKTYSDIITLINSDSFTRDQWVRSADKAFNDNLAYESFNLAVENESLTQSGKKLSKTSADRLGRNQRRLAYLNDTDAARMPIVSPGLSVTDLSFMVNENGFWNTPPPTQGIAINPFSEIHEDQMSHLPDGLILSSYQKDGYFYTIIGRNGELNLSDADKTLLENMGLKESDIIDMKDRKSIIATMMNMEKSAEPARNYFMNGIQRGYDNEPLFTFVTIDDPTHPFNESTITVPGVATHDEILEAIEIKRGTINPPPKYAKMEDNNFNGRRINPDYLQTADKKELMQILNDEENGLHHPSDILDAKLNKLSRKSNAVEIQLLREEFPSAFSADTNPNLDIKQNPEYQYRNPRTIEEHEAVLIDYLVEHPEDMDGNGLKTTKKDRSKLRKKLVRQFAYYNNRLKTKMDEGLMDGINSDDADIGMAIAEVIDYISNDIDPEAISNRMLRALSLAMKQFVNSNGNNVRGFSTMYMNLKAQQMATAADAAYFEMRQGGISEPFGLPITDRMRNLPGRGNIDAPGTSLADSSLELLRVFPSQKARDIMAKIMSNYHYGIAMYKRSYNAYADSFRAFFDGVGTTTMLEDSRIGAAQLIIQFDEAGLDIDRDAEVRQNIARVLESVSRKELVPDHPNVKHHKRLAPVERMAITQLLDGIQNSYTTMPYTDIIDHIKSKLSPKEWSVMDEIIRFGERHYQSLNLVQQMSRGKPLTKFANYSKRVSVPLNGEKIANTWGEKAIQSPDGIFRDREGLGEGQVYNLNWRSNFDFQLNETMYEINTGITRVALFNAMTRHKRPGAQLALSDVLDRDQNGAVDPARLRSSRFANVIGNTHSNLKNQETKLTGALGAVAEIIRLTFVAKLISLRAPLNQLIPYINSYIAHPDLSAQVSYYMTNPTYKKNVDTFIRDMSPDLFYRLGRNLWDERLRSFKNDPRRKRTGMPNQSVTEKIIENGFMAASGVGAASKGAIKYAFGAALRATNGMTEVLSARHVFITMYVNELMRRGLIATPEDFFQQGIPRASQGHKDALTAATIEFDKFTVSPINPEMRSEISQRNSGNKILWNLMTMQLARTRIQQSARSVSTKKLLYDAYKEYQNSRGPLARQYLQQMIKESAIADMNVAMYTGISMAMRALYGGFGVTAAALAGITFGADEEEKEKWKRRFDALLQVERDKTTRFITSQAFVDMASNYVPLSAVFLSNPSNAAMQASAKFINEIASGGIGDPDIMAAEIKELRDTQKSIEKQMKNLQTLGTLTDSDSEKALKANEIITFAEQMLKRREQMKVTLADIEKEIANKDARRSYFQAFGKSLADEVVRSSAPIGDSFDQIKKIGGAAIDTILPKDVANAIMSRNEQSREARNFVEKSRENTAMGSIEWFLNSPLASLTSFDSAGVRTRSRVIEEWSKEKAKKEIDARERMEKALKFINQ